MSSRDSQQNSQLSRPLKSDPPSCWTKFKEKIFSFFKPTRYDRSSSSLHTSSYDEQGSQSFVTDSDLSQFTTDDESEALHHHGVPRGLLNLGNTCYMNAVIQTLYSVQAFRNLIVNSATRKGLCHELQKLFKEMQSSISPVSPTSFKSTFSKYQNKFFGLRQQDAQEFLRYLMNGLQDELNSIQQKPRHSARPASPKSADQAWRQYRETVDDSPLVDLLVGLLCSTICCSICRSTSNCWAPFWDLSLPLTRSNSQDRLSEVINNFIAEETLDGDERPTCSKCKIATKSTKRISFSKLPQVLVLHLKKFSNDGYKLSSPEVIIEKKIRLNNINYQIQACISHHGHSSCSGHYTSHCKYDGKWFHFNDER